MRIDVGVMLIEFFTNLVKKTLKRIPLKKFKKPRTSKVSITG